MKVELVLAIENEPKTIPYKPEKRPTSQNHGFKPIKGKPEEARLIPEAQDNIHIQNALIAINHIDTAFFSVGCEKSFNRTKGKSWAKGFIEFAFNHPELVRDAQNYFKLFFDFNIFCLRNDPDLRVKYFWQFQPVTFLDAGPDCRGYVCCVWVQTDYFDSPSMSKKTWEGAVDFLASYLGQIYKPNSLTIY